MKIELIIKRDFTTSPFNLNKINIIKSLDDYIKNLEFFKLLIESNKFDKLELLLNKTNYIKKILKGIN